jgi:hypothetical protein
MPGRKRATCLAVRPLGCRRDDRACLERARQRDRAGGHPGGLVAFDRRLGRLRGQRHLGCGGHPTQHLGRADGVPAQADSAESMIASVRLLTA